MDTVMKNLLEVLNFHSTQYSLIKQGKNLKTRTFISNMNTKMIFFSFRFTKIR